MSTTINKVSRLKILCSRKSWSLTQRTQPRARPLTFSYLSSPRHVTCSNVRFYSNSSIFISDRSKNVSANFQFDHGLGGRLADIDTLEKNLRLRGFGIDVELLKADYNRFCELEQDKVKLEATREKIAKTIAGLVKVETEQIVSKESTEQIKELREEGKQTRQALKQLMTEYWDVEERLMMAALSLPNDTSSDVTEKEKVLDSYYEDTKITSTDSHLDIVARCKHVKFSNVGERAYYLKGRLAVLEQELIERFSTELQTRGITPMLAPEIFKTPVVEAGGLDVGKADSIYRLHHKPIHKHLSDWDQDNLYLRGASHLSFLAYLARTNIQTDSFPIKLSVLGRNYIPEARSNRELPGLLGVLQTVKIFMCGVCDSPEASTNLFQQFQTSITEIYKHFGIPFKLVYLPISSLSGPEQNRIELQMWVPSLQQYIQVASLAEYGDYNSRRLMIRCSTGKQPSVPVYMVHCEVVDVTRLIGILLEHDLVDTDWGTSFNQTPKIEVVDILD